MLGCNAHSRWLSNSRAITRWLALPPRSRNLMATISPVSVFSASWTKPEAPLRVEQGRISIWIDVCHCRYLCKCAQQSRTADANNVRNSCGATARLGKMRGVAYACIQLHVRRETAGGRRRSPLPVQVLQLPIPRIILQRLCEGILLLLLLAAAAFLLRWVADLRRVALEAAVNRMVRPVAKALARQCLHMTGSSRRGRGCRGLQRHC